MRVSLLSLALALAVAGPAPASAEFPEQPIRLIVPTGAGGGMDGTARIVQRTIDENDLLPETLAIVNMPGAGGTIGTRAVKDAEPDGYTLGFWHEGLVTSAAMGVTDYDQDAFEIVGGTGFVDLGLGVKADSDIGDLDTLLERGREAPDTIKAGTNMGITVHFFPLLVAEAGGATFRFVQVGGGAKRLASVLGGHTDFAAFGVNEFVTHEAAGLKPIVVLTDERHPALPDVPTAKESGIDVTARHTRIWLAPKGTPDDRLETVREALRGAMSNPGLIEEFNGLGVSPVFIEPEDIRARLDAFGERIAPLVETVQSAAQ